MKNMIAGALTAGMLLVPAATASGVAVPTGLTPVSAEQGNLPVPSVSIAQDVPATGVDLTSKSGRYVISGNVLYDRQKKRTVKRFPGGIRSLSDDGRYVTYIVDGRAGKAPFIGRLQRIVKVYDRKKGRTRTATATSGGRALRPAWKGTCRADDGCGDDGFSITDGPQLQGGHMSGNGHYIVFCANYLKPDRVDLYIKNWRTKRLSVVRGACSYDNDADAGGQNIQPPLVNENGDTILLAGPRSYGEEGAGTWGPSKALLNRKRLVEVGGITPTMTHDGRVISVKGAFRSDTYWDDPLPVTWYSVRAGTSTPADPAGLQLDMRNASRRGRYFVNLVYQGQEQPRFTITDRALASTYDLGAALNSAGYRPQNGSPVLSGDGKIVFTPTEQGWVSINWTP
jgi:hypothetical protein